MDAFAGLHHESRRAVMRLLKLESGLGVDAALTESMINRIDEERKKSGRFVLISSRALIDHLKEHLRTCASLACIGKNWVSFEEYMPFEMHSRKDHCFHLACPKEAFR
jgi:hypothetical protein